MVLTNHKSTSPRSDLSVLQASGPAEEGAGRADQARLPPPEDAQAPPGGTERDLSLQQPLQITQEI